MRPCTTAVLLLVMTMCESAYGSFQEPPQTAVQRLVEDLQRRNPGRVRPVMAASDNVTLQIAVAPKTIVLDDAKQQMILDAWSFLTWHDAFLTWDPELFGGVHRIQLDPADMWLPDIAIYNSVSGDGQPVFGSVPVLVMYTGNVLWFPPTHATVPCKLDLHLWPADQHNCSVNYGSWVHHGEQIDLRVLANDSGIMLENYEEGTNWHVVRHGGQRRVLDVAGTKHVDIVFSFVLRRQATHEASYITVSTLVIIVCVLATYTLPASQLLPRMMLHIFSLSVLIGCYFVLFASLPSNGGPLPHVVRYYSGSMFISTLSLMVTLWLYSLSRNTTGGYGFVKKIRRATQNVGRYSTLINRIGDSTDTDVSGATVLNNMDVEPNSGGADAPSNVNSASAADSDINLLQQAKLERKEQQKRLKIKVINLCAAVLFTVAFTIEYIVLQVTVGS